MRITILIYLALPWLILNTGAQSIDTNKPIHLLSLDDCLTMALQRNYDIQITRLGPQIERSRLEASFGLYDPVFDTTVSRNFNAREGGFIPGSTVAQPNSERTTDSVSPGFRGVLPTGLSYDLGIDFNHNTGTFAPFYDGQAGITLRQPLLKNSWTDATRTQIKVNRKNLKIAEWIFYRQLMDTMAAVQQAYYELIFAIEDVKVKEKAVELANRQVDEEIQRVKIGVRAALDEQLAASEAARALGDLIRARQTRLQQENVLKNLIVDNFTQWQPVRLEPTEKLVAVPTSYDLQESWTKGLALRPEYARAKLELERQDIDLKFRINQLFPALDAFGSYGRNSFDGPPTSSFSGTLADLRDETAPKYSYGLVLTVPLGNRDARFRRDESRALREQLRLFLDQIKQGIIQQIDDTVTLSKANYERVSTTRAQREYAEADLDAMQKKFANGVSTSFDVLDRQSRVTSARSAEIRALADYTEALIRLYRAEGTTLERLRINVEMK